jgi:hypothetical protein
VTIFSTAYESFCLAAHEAALLGSMVVVNNNNPAFGDDTPWIDEENCFKFDGGIRHLTERLQYIWSNRGARLSRPTLNTGDPYWMHHFDDAGYGRTEEVRGIDLTIVVPVRTEELGWLDSIAPFLLLTALRLQILIVCDLNTRDNVRSEVVAALDDAVRKRGGTARRIDLDYNEGLAGMLNFGVRSSIGRYIAIVTPGSIMDPDFVVRACELLEERGDFDLAIPQVGYPRYTESAVGVHVHRCVIGEALNSSVFTNVMSGIDFIARRETLIELEFDEDLDRYVDWDFLLRATTSGRRTACLNTVGVIANGAELSGPFRSHLDRVLVKHTAEGGPALGLLLAFDAGAGQATGTEIVKRGRSKKRQPSQVTVAGQPLSYYQREAWWRLAYRHPTKPLRWLLAFDEQRRKKKSPVEGPRPAPTKKGDRG